MADKLKKLIASSPVLVLSKTTCGYCSRAKALLEQHAAKPTIIELNTVEDGPALQAATLQLTGQRTVPSIWIKGKHIGGYDNLSALDGRGELTAALAEARM
jgi:glutaredoxin 3